MKVKSLLLTALLAVVGGGASYAQTDVTSSYIGFMDAVVGNANWHSGCTNNHKPTGNGWYNTQTITGDHAFAAPGNGTGESWSPEKGSTGVMMGRTITLPAGHFTLSFDAFGCTATNAAQKTLPTAGDVVAFCTGQENVDITNVQSLGQNAFHTVSFDLDVTVPNTVIEFGIKKVVDSPAEWCQIKNVKLMLTSTDVFPVSNDNISSFVYTGTQTWHTNTWSTEGNADKTEFRVPFHELWVARGNKLENATITGSYTPSQNGVYKVTAWVRALNESGGAVEGAKIFVGDVEADACGGAAIPNGTLGTYTAMADGVADQPIAYGFKLENATFNWLSFKNVTITYLGAGLPDADVEALVATVPTGRMDATVQSTLNGYVTALQTGKTVAAYNTLAAYIPTAQASINAYAAAKSSADAAKSKAEHAGINVTDVYAAFFEAYENGTLDGTTQVDAIEVAYQTAICTEMADIKANYPNSSDEVLNTDISKWTTSDYAVMNNNEHWSGVQPYKYYEQTSEEWGKDSWSKNASQTVNLPAGHYAFVVTARASIDVVSTMTVNGTTVDLPTFGSEGKGITTDGTASYTEGTFAKDGKGYGWEYRFVKFELTEPTDVTFALASSTNMPYNWVSIANPTLYYMDDAKDAMEAVLIKAAKDELASLIENYAVPTVNVGNGAFQYGEGAIADLNALLSAAQAVCDNDAATLDDVKGQIAIVENLKLPALNAPADGQKFNVVLDFAGWDYNGKAMTYLANDRQDMGNYNIQYFAEPNGNFAQAFTMTQVEGNRYKMSQLDAENVARYISTGTAYPDAKGTASQIRTTTDAAKALEVEIIPTSTEGVYNLWNTEAKQYIGSQDAGVFTVNSHTTFRIVEAAQIPGIVISAAGYGTYVAPVAVAVPAGVKAYTVDGVEDEVLTMSEVTTIAANTPVVVEGAAMTGDKQGYANVNPAQATVGLLTGVYTTTPAQDGWYILQNNDGKVAFYHVNTETATPNVPANRCYLTVPSGAKPRAFYFNHGDATGIDAINALTAGNAEIYTVDGARINSLQKGMNIVKINGKIQKVLVK